MYNHVIIILTIVIKMIVIKGHIWLYDYVWTLVTNVLIIKPHFGVVMWKVDTSVCKYFIIWLEMNEHKRWKRKLEFLKSSMKNIGVFLNHWIL